MRGGRRRCSFSMRDSRVGAECCEEVGEKRAVGWHLDVVWSDKGHTGGVACSVRYLDRTLSLRWI